MKNAGYKRSQKEGKGQALQRVCPFCLEYGMSVSGVYVKYIRSISEVDTEYIWSRCEVDLE
jgi:hypothetical protein